MVATTSVEVIDIGRNRTLEIRPTTPADAPLLHELYQPMSADDRHRRFFTAAAPQLTWCQDWTSVAERGGHGLIAIVHDGDRHTVVGEAGYALRQDGDGDLAVAVAPGWRGWLGSYLVELLAQHAASNGIDNLQADVLLDNRPMLTILRRRGSVNLEHADGTVRVTIGTAASTPSWPPKATGHRLLVEAAGGRWSGERAANKSGGVTALCSGPSGRTGDACPVLTGGHCPLADTADAIVIVLDPDDERTEQLAALHRRHRPGVPIFVSRRLAERAALPADCIELAASGSDSVSQILSLIGSAPERRPESAAPRA